MLLYVNFAFNMYISFARIVKSTFSFIKQFCWNDTRSVEDASTNLLLHIQFKVAHVHVDFCMYMYVMFELLIQYLDQKQTNNKHLHSLYSVVISMSE